MFKKPQDKKGSKRSGTCDKGKKQAEHREVLSPVKLNTLDRLEVGDGVVTRSRSPFKSPMRIGSGTPINNVNPPKSTSNLSPQSPARSPSSGLNSKSPSKSFLRRLDLSSPSKSPSKRLDFTSPCRVSLRHLDLPSPSKSPLRANKESPSKLPCKSFGSLGDLSAKSPQVKRLDFGSPRRSPRKVTFEESSPRRSPRKLTFSPRKVDSPSSLVSKLSLSSPASNKKSAAVGLFKPNGK